MMLSIPASVALYTQLKPVLPAVSPRFSAASAEKSQAVPAASPAPEDPIQDTFLAIKPDGVRRGLVGRLIQRFEDKGLTLTAMKLMRASEDLAATHYQEHKYHPLFKRLTTFISSGPLVAMVWRGPGAVQQARSIIGPYKAEKRQPGTIRGDFTTSGIQNVMHSSDSPEAAQREIGLFFQPSARV